MILQFLLPPVTFFQGPTGCLTKWHLEPEAWTSASSGNSELMQALAFGHLNNVLTQPYRLHCEHIFIIRHLEMPPRATLTKINIYREQESEGPGASSLWPQGSSWSCCSKAGEASPKVVLFVGLCSNQLCILRTRTGSFICPRSCWRNCHPRREEELGNSRKGTVVSRDARGKTADYRTKPGEKRNRDLSAFPWGYSPWLEGTFCAGKK